MSKICCSNDEYKYVTKSNYTEFAMAKEAMLRGADVTVIKASKTAPIPHFVKIIDVASASEMFDKVKELSDSMDIIIKAAAVVDYTSANYCDEKVKKKEGDLSINLVRTKDILAYLGEHKREKQFLCRFSMETENLVENSTAKLKKKKADIIVSKFLVLIVGAGFGTDTNLVTLITNEGAEELEMMPKEIVANKIYDKIFKMLQ